MADDRVPMIMEAYCTCGCFMHNLILGTQSQPGVFTTPSGQPPPRLACVRCKQPLPKELVYRHLVIKNVPYRCVDCGKRVYFEENTIKTTDIPFGIAVPASVSFFLNDAGKIERHTCGIAERVRPLIIEEV